MYGVLMTNAPVGIFVWMFCVSVQFPPFAGSQGLPEAVTAVSRNVARVRPLRLPSFVGVGRREDRQ